MSALDLIAVGLVAPGIPDWGQGRAVLAGTLPYVPAPIPNLVPAALPPNERRRATQGTRLVLEAGAQALAGLDLDPSRVPSVFAASESDLGIIDRLCTEIFGQGIGVSPIVFHNSVHNAVAGYWSIAQGCRAPSISLSAWDGSLAAGLLESAAQLHGGEGGQPLLLVAYDLPGPWPIDAHRHLAGPFACALVLAARDGSAPSAGRPLAGLVLGLGPRGPEDRLPPALGDPLETLRGGNPAARVLPLLRRIAAADPGPVRLPYLDDLDLIVEVQCPC
jgi:hypothetical protein